ncbi:MAG: 2-isopropylmalate synthase [Magnetococcus sp. THC-1_WYH]
MLTTIKNKYRPAPSIPMTARHWPDQVLTQSPRWCSTDLRDGNQSLATPMNPQRKGQMLQLLVAMGFTEIEAGFPAASKDDLDFIRRLVGKTPDGVTIQVLTSAREDHIRQTLAAVRGLPRVNVHFYISTSPVQRRVVFGVDEQTVIQRAVDAATWIRTLALQQPQTQWTFQFTPESFSATEPEFSLAICEAVADVWEPTPQHKIILNLPATVEVAAPHRYADQIEWFGTHFSRRDAVVLSIHPHNDRGCGVAAAELALLAGAERVEGALFGNGERTGNLDLVTLAMNLHSQGIETGLDFSDMPRVVACYQACTGMDISPRQPYAGSLVFTAFSGSHQDAIRKGLAAWQPGQPWEVPYIPVDPRDMGYDFSGIIRVNSQSGKAGACHLLEQERGIRLPKWLEPEFAREVQRVTDEQGGEVTSLQVATLFEDIFLTPSDGVALRGYRLFQEEHCRVEMELLVDGVTCHVTGMGNGPIDAAFHAVPGPWSLQQYEERALNVGSSARAIAFIFLADAENDCTGWSGVGIHEDIVAASLAALCGAIRRFLSAENGHRRQAILAGWGITAKTTALAWDPQGYAQHSHNQYQQAMMRMARMGLKSGDSVLDIGCGDGKITAQLAQRVYPGGVYGIDASLAMIELAQDRFPASRHPNLSFAVMDAGKIQVREPVDWVFSNAALHWIHDHRPVLSGICQALRPGGRFHLDMGGRGNAQQVFRVLEVLSARSPWSTWIGGMENPYAFYSDAEYWTRLREAGLIGHRVALVPCTWSFPDRDRFEGWIGTTWLPFTQRIPPELRQQFITALTECYATLFPPDRDGVMTARMVRLEVEGQKGDAC